MDFSISKSKLTEIFECMDIEVSQKDPLLHMIQGINEVVFMRNHHSSGLNISYIYKTESSILGDCSISYEHFCNVISGITADTINIKRDGEKLLINNLTIYVFKLTEETENELNEDTNTTGNLITHCEFTLTKKNIRPFSYIEKHLELYKNKCGESNPEYRHYVEIADEKFITTNGKIMYIYKDNSFKYIDNNHSDVMIHREVFKAILRYHSKKISEAETTITIKKLASKKRVELVGEFAVLTTYIEFGNLIIIDRHYTDRSFPPFNVVVQAVQNEGHGYLCNLNPKKFKEFEFKDEIALKDIFAFCEEPEETTKYFDSIYVKLAINTLYTEPSVALYSQEATVNHKREVVKNAETPIVLYTPNQNIQVYIMPFSPAYLKAKNIK